MGKTQKKIVACDWQSMKNKLTERGKEILKTREWTDCKFIVGQEPQQQETIEAHKLIMAMSSSVFAAMFFGEMRENNKPIFVPDVRPETFKALLEYIYTDNVNRESLKLVCELCYCADKYMLPFLKRECLNFVFSDLSAKKVCQAYELTKLLAEPVLMAKCLNVIRTETDDVLRDSSIEDIELETLLTILEQENLRIKSEAELFSAVERWAVAKCRRKGLDPESGEAIRSVCGNALTKIRFLTLTSQEFGDCTKDSILIKESEIAAILRNISPGKLKFPMPEGFSNDTKRRVNPPYEKIDSSMVLLMPNWNGTTLKDRRNGDQIPENAISEDNPLKMILVEHKEVKKDLEYYCHKFTFQRRDVNALHNRLSKFSESLKTTKNIIVNGILIPSQISESVSSYLESLIVRVMDERSQEITMVRYKAKIKVGSLIKIMFDKPVFLPQQKLYNFSIEFETRGCYPKLPCRKEISLGDIIFTFGGETSHDLISSIIYTPLA